MVPEEYEETGIPVNASRYAEYCVAQERERCARIAEQAAIEENDPETRTSCFDIAERIRTQA